MLRESLITFSLGQPKLVDVASNSTEPAAPAGPLYEFGAVPLSGAEQVSLDSVAASSSISLNGALSTRDAVKIPSGADFAPRLKLGSRGRASILKTRQLWEGTVTEVRKTGFVAVLRDKTNPSYPDEQAVFDNSEISTEDLPLVTPGSSFYWVIGNEISYGGQLKNVSLVQFRRMPVWPHNTLERARLRAHQLKASLQEKL